MQLHYSQGHAVENCCFLHSGYYLTLVDKNLLTPHFTISKKEIFMIGDHYSDKYASTAEGLTLILK